MTIDKMAKTIIEAVKHSENKGTQPYDTTAEVIRVEGDTAWVYISGGVSETPVKKTINCVKGDIVQVRVGGGSAWITGNESKPPTDDAKADVANETAITASKRARTAFTTAENAQTTASNALNKANQAQTSADGKNTIYYGITQPTGGSIGDTWFNEAEDNAIYRFNGTTWVKAELGEDAIANLSITNAKIADGTIQNAKIGNLDAGKITSGTIDSNRLNIGEIISVGDIAVEGDIPTKLSQLTNDSSYATTGQVSTAKNEAEATASADATAKANEAKKTATNFLTVITGTTGISVHDTNDTSNYVNIASNLFKIVTGGVERFKAWVENNVAKVRVGAETAGHVLIQSSGMDVYGGDGTENLAHIGYDYGNDAQGGLVEAPYYTFGTRGIGDIGNYSFVQGTNCTAEYIAAHAEGIDSQAKGGVSHAEGYGCIAWDSSHAEGQETTACNGSHAEGQSTVAGTNTGGNGQAHAEGAYTNAVHNVSHAEGFHTDTGNAYQHVQGQYNQIVNGYADVVGWGTYSSRKNISALDIDGNLKLKGDVYVGCNDDSTGGSKLFPASLTRSGATAVSVAHATWTALDDTSNPDNSKVEITEAGIYILFGAVRFSSNATGRRAIRWYNTTSSEAVTRSNSNTTAVSGVETYVQTTLFTEVTTPTTYRLQAYHNAGSGTSLNVTPYISVVRLA